MLLKKMMCLALGIGIGAGVCYMCTNQSSVDQKVKCLKRKIKKVERELSSALDKINTEQMQKYKTELETKLKEIKTKIDNLTIKDIKDSASNALNTIKQNINNLSHKVSSLMTSESNS